jgi:hypothetical protein
VTNGKATLHDVQRVSKTEVRDVPWEWVVAESAAALRGEALRFMRRDRLGEVRRPWGIRQYGLLKKPVLIRAHIERTDLILDKSLLEILSPGPIVRTCRAS